MRALVVEAKSAESALALYTSLSAFLPELRGDDASGYRVTVSLGEGNKDVIAILYALERHISRSENRASVHLDGRRYTVEPSEG